MLEKLNATKTGAFVLLIIISSVIYYKYILPDDSNKIINMFKRVIVVIVLIGLLNILSNINSVTGKFIILVIMIILVNLYNIHHSIKKCSLNSEYKINLFLKSSAIFFILALLILYTIQGDFLRFLYSEKTILDTGDASPGMLDNIKLAKIIPDYCPDMDSLALCSEYRTEISCDGGDDPTKGNDNCKWDNKNKICKLKDDSNTWNILNDDQKENCLDAKEEKYRRTEIASNIYA
jgi:hypothetical protein